MQGQMPAGFVPDGFEPDAPPAGGAMNFAIVNGQRVPIDEDPNTLGTFATHVGAQINPLTAVQAVSNAVMHPVDTAQAIGAAQGALFDKAKASYEKGDYLTAARHFVDYLLPIVGPTLDASADHMQKGQLAAGAGDAVGLGLSLFGPDALTAARRTAPAAAVADRTAAAADARFADVMSPKGASRSIQRTGKQALNVAEDVRQGTTAITPSGLHAQIADRLANASEALDEAYGALPKTAYSTGPLLARLQGAYNALRVRGTNGAVVPTALAERASTIQKAIDEVRQLGPYTNTDNLAQLRNAWKQGAKDAFVPEINPNFQQIREASKGWADAWSAVQDTLTERHPELKGLNADYHVWKQASDVMEALANQQRSKPTVGRGIMARAGGAAVGGATAGPKGALVGELVGPLVERGITNSLAPATKILVARQLGNLADAIRLSQPTRIEIVLKQLRPLLVANNAPRAAQTATPAFVPAFSGAPAR